MRFNPFVGNSLNEGNPRKMLGQNQFICRLTDRVEYP